MAARRRPSGSRRADSSSTPDAGAAGAALDFDLAALGLALGDTVRFRRRDGANWQVARVDHVNRDGSVALRDGKGASRSIPPERLEVRVDGPRGGEVWEPVAERAARPHQLPMI
jgi:hypothetical protein